MTEAGPPPSGWDPRNSALVVLALGTVMRFLLAESIGLGVDESYAVAVSRQLALSYFDHPPLHFWIAGAIAKLAHSESREVVRLPFVLCFALTTWLMYRLGARLFGERAGAIAALLLNVSAVFSLSTGGWVLPDGPLMLFMLASTLVIAGVLLEATPSRATLRWALAGLFAGLAMLSKYHGAFVVAGAFAFLLTSAPHRWWLRTPGPWVFAAVASACLAPVIVWNYRHGWVSFRFQGGRAAGTGGIHPETMLANIGAQAAWVLPWIWVPLVAALWGALRRGTSDARRWFLVCLAIGPLAGFTLIALHGSVGLPHWQAPGYLMLFPLLGSAVAARLERGDTLARRWLGASVWGFAGLVLLLGSHTATGWLDRLFPAAFAKGDPTGDTVDWRLLKPALQSHGLLPLDGFIAAPSWIQASKAAIGLGPDVKVLCLCADPHHFYYMQNDSAFLGANAVIAKKVTENDDVPAEFAPYFEEITPLDVVPVMRAGQVVMRVALYRAKGFRKLFPTEQPR
ncbi:MAG TPA: glycosyltransferase family 39 protein [Gemmatimonadaceae bacterium]|nr:glycosyltransferase family 39 protein [Gemmatimonadaceae bacterium]